MRFSQVHQRKVADERRDFQHGNPYDSTNRVKGGTKKQCFLLMDHPQGRPPGPEPLSFRLDYVFRARHFAQGQPFPGAARVGPLKLVIWAVSVKASRWRAFRWRYAI